MRIGVGDTPPTDVSWRREEKGGLRSLPHERKTLAERYTIDAEEAERRARLAADEEAARQRAAEQAARREAEEEAARRAAADEAARRNASEAMERELAEREAAAFASPEPSDQLVATAPDHEEPAEQTADLPIYRWFDSR